MVGAMGKDEKESFGRSYHIWGELHGADLRRQMPYLFFFCHGVGWHFIVAILTRV